MVVVAVVSDKSDADLSGRRGGGGDIGCVTGAHSWNSKTCSCSCCAVCSACTVVAKATVISCANSLQLSFPIVGVAVVFVVVACVCNTASSIARRRNFFVWAISRIHLLSKPIRLGSCCKTCSRYCGCLFDCKRDGVDV